MTSVMASQLAIKHEATGLVCRFYSPLEISGKGFELTTTALIETTIRLFSSVVSICFSSQFSLLALCMCNFENNILKKKHVEIAMHIHEKHLLIGRDVHQTEVT